MCLALLPLQQPPRAEYIQGGRRKLKGGEGASIDEEG